MSDIINTENNLPTNLEQLTVEIKFYVNQWGQLSRCGGVKGDVDYVSE